MSTKKETTEAKLRRQIAETEAMLAALQERLAKLTTPQEKEAPTDDLKTLWKAALPISRTRSSQHLCRKEWNKIPKADRPAIEELVRAITAWNRSPEWKKDGNAYAPGLHRWIKERRWLDLPESSEAPSRHRAIPKPAPPQDSGPGITDRAEIAALLSIEPKRMKS